MNSMTDTLRSMIDEADALLIGAGGGVTSAAMDEKKLIGGALSPWASKYGFSDPCRGMFAPFEDASEFWGYISTLANAVCFEGMDEYGVYSALRALTEGKDTFVITTNTDGMFVKNGFAPGCVFESYGNMSYLQCAGGHSNEITFGEDVLKRLAASVKDGRADASLVPLCPECKGAMVPWVRSSGFFAECGKFRTEYERYDAFLRSHSLKRVLLLELGAGMETAGVIKMNFRRLCDELPNAFYCSVNIMGEETGQDLQEKSLIIKGDLRELGE
ncbi:MAG: hypothetical protein IKP75_03660 [Oscillospiraceae bacterium]|nr:hypothetical protein [Oscillospiraceae bacterium]